MEYLRGDRVGSGSFATVNKAIPTKKSDLLPPVIAVKSAAVKNSASLLNEKEILDRLGSCPEIIRCFGDHYSAEKDGEFYNLLLEFAGNGSLADYSMVCGGRLPESDVRQYSRMILKGLGYIHGKGFVHCDVKPQNILMFDDGVVKIADFGLAKLAGKSGCRGSPMYMSPEIVKSGEFQSAADIWAFGCSVVEIFSGKPAWNIRRDSNVFELLMRIGGSDELPEIPKEFSDEGKDFLGKIFVKDPRKRWTAEKLLDHPFVANLTVPMKIPVEISESPRSHFDFPGSESSTLHSTFSKENDFPEMGSSPEARIRQLATDRRPDSSFSGSWVSVR